MALAAPDKPAAGLSKASAGRTTRPSGTGRAGPITAASFSLDDSFRLRPGPSHLSPHPTARDLRKSARVRRAVRLHLDEVRASCVRSLIDARPWLPSAATMRLVPACVAACSSNRQVTYQTPAAPRFDASRQRPKHDELCARGLGHVEPPWVPSGILALPARSGPEHGSHSAIRLCPIRPVLMFPNCDMTRARAARRTRVVVAGGFKAQDRNLKPRHVTNTTCE